MAEGKWIAGLSPEMDLVDAARKALDQRLTTVAECLPDAIAHAYDDDEHVHQLRVATRRADACLRIFRACLPKRVYRATRERLRTIRRAAGAARDADVFLAALRERSASAKAGDLAGLDFLVAYTLGQREVAQEDLEGVEAGQKKAFGAIVKRALEAVRPGSEKSLGDLARPQVVELVAALDAATRQPLDDYDHLHQVRIAGKRVRYALEILATCFGCEIRERVYPQIEEMQEILGRANDSHVAVMRLQRLKLRLAEWSGMKGRAKGGIEGLLRFHQRRLPQERKRFLAWLEVWRAMGVDGMLGAVPE